MSCTNTNKNHCIDVLAVCWFRKNPILFMAPILIRKKYVVVFLITLILFLLFVPYITPSAMPAECIFCKIVQGKIPETKIEMETEEFVVFADIKPASEHHYLAVSKRHIESLKSLTKADENLVLNMESGLKQVFGEKGIDTSDALFGFHLPPFISVKHLHMHGIAPRSSMNFLHSFMFKPSSPWFRTVDDARKYLNEKA